MPPRSESQRRLMEAAAHTKGGVDGVSQSVGQEFAEADPGGKLPAKASKADRRYGAKEKGRG